jgi:cupin 2 domain-containing protein
MDNVYSSLPVDLAHEVFEELFGSEHVRIERIISRGHTSPAQGWYDQPDHEWVLVLEGAATLLFADGVEARLKKGDYLNIPSHTRHKVTWTDPNVITIWLAVFYS